jgi:hypothetical protein
LISRLAADMTGSGNKRKFTVIDLILIVLILVMVYALYVLVGGDLAAFTRPETYSGGESPFAKLVGSLSAFGQGLKDAFGGLAP